MQALDLGVIRASGALQSTRDATEHYLITAFAPGSVYAQDLRRIAAYLAPDLEGAAFCPIEGKANPQKANFGSPAPGKVTLTSY